MSRELSFKYKKALLSFMLILLFFLVMSNVFIVSNQRQQHLDNIQKQMHTQVDLLGTFSREPLLRHDYAKIEEFLVQWAEEHDQVIEMKAIMPNNFMLVDYHRKKPTLNTLNSRWQVKYGDRVLMTLTMIMDFSQEEKIIRNLQMQLIAGSVILACILGAALWFSLRRMAITPLEREVAVRKNAEEMLRKARDQLEIRVQERTAELKNSEEKYHSLILNIPSVIWTSDREGNTSFISPNIRRLFGFTAEEIYEADESPWFSRIHPEDIEQVTKAYDDLFDKGVPFDSIYRIQKMDGEWIWLHDRAMTTYEKDGVHCADGIFSDITEIKEIEQNLLKEKMFSDMVINSLPGIFYLFDDKGNFQVWNKNFERITEYSAEEICRMNPIDFFEGENKKLIADKIHEVLVKGESNIEATIVTKSGKKLNYYFNGFRLKIENKQHIVGTGIDISERIRAEESLRISEDKFSKAFRSSPTFISISIVEDGRYLDVNDTFLEASGYSREDIIGHTSLELGIWADPGDRTKMIKMIREQGSVNGLETQLRMKNDEIHTVLYSAELIHIENEPCILAVKLDITERKRLASQLLHAQKMEAVGQLAGGVAHDFNNILTAIISNTFLLKNRTREDDTSRELAEKIIALSNNAAKVVQELLVFSRKEKSQMSLVHLNDIIKGVRGLLTDFISKEIDISAKYSNKELSIMADKSQLEQVIINLATNARDAMPDGGTLTIETDLVEIDDRYIKKHGLGKPGVYALLSVIDSGMGMDQATRERIFEPFFTTKEVGKGTGLGLSIIYGIIKQHKGFLNVSSELGRGTTFRIYFPRAEAIIGV
jgi:PAS domain S-box-containing protein